MNPVIELLTKHCSIRRFKDEGLGEGVLEALILAGQSASTSSYIQATSVIRVTERPLREQMMALSGDQPYVGGASEFMIFCADFHRNGQRIKELDGSDADFSWTEQFISATVDVALFAQNVVIAAESEGLGCCYIGGIRNAPDQVAQLLALPTLVYPVFGLCIGVPNQNPVPKPRLPISAVLHENRYSYSDETVQAIDSYDATVQKYYRDRTKGALDQSWSEQMSQQSKSQTRPHMKKHINKQGFMVN